MNDEEDYTQGGQDETPAISLVPEENSNAFPLTFPITFGGSGDINNGNNTVFNVVKGSGCPLCGSRNPRGDFKTN